MSHYGVRKLVVINSGGYVYAELDLTKPVHLVAPNNRGKSTLVNALQFLYVDDPAKMAFGRTMEDTRRHYFGQDPSYLIYECATPSGTQCMLVRGLGPLRHFGFDRFAFQGEYQRLDFEGDNRRVVSFDVLRTRLANRNLLEVPAKQLWEVLSGQIPANDGNGPRLAILPLRKLDEYKAFRDVFVSLLKLSNMDGKSLKELIIACHARDITEMRIDIAADYKAEFERAERADHEAAFLHAVRDQIDQGAQVRADEAAILAHVTTTSRQIVTEARSLQGQVAHYQGELAAAAVKMTQERDAKADERSRLDREAGKQEQCVKLARGAREVLEADHRKWEAYSPLRLQSLRDRIETFSDEIASLRQNLQRNMDVPTLQAQVAKLEHQLRKERDAHKNWDSTAAATLRNLGMSEPHLFTTFRLLNPDLLDLIVGQTLTIKNSEGLLANLAEIRERVDRGIYRDACVEVTLESVAGPDLRLIRSKERLADQIKLTDENLEQASQQLKIAEDQALAQKQLLQKTTEYKKCQEELSAYESHVKAWANRAELEARVNEAEEQLKSVEGKVAAAKKKVEDLNGAIRDLREKEDGLREIAKMLRDRLREFGDVMSAIGAELLPLNENPIALGELAPEALLTLLKHASQVAKQLTELGTQAAKIRPLRDQLQLLENLITKKAGQFGYEPIYFTDRDEEWQRLIEQRESLDSVVEVSKRQWDALFVTLGQRLNGIRLGMRSIEHAVTRINAGLKRYHVSNLREVQLKIERSSDTYPMVEALTSLDGMFQNRDELDAAKTRLRIMIESAQSIELQSLFALHIRVQQNDGHWTEAKSLDEIGSTGTGITAKCMIFIQLVRAIVGNERYRLHFYLDETGRLDDHNLYATTSMAVSKGVMPITAQPDVRIDPLAHPAVTVYALGQNAKSQFCIAGCNTYHAQRSSTAAEQATGTVS